MPRNALERLLNSMFVSGDDLRRFIWRLPDGERLVGELPGPTASKSAVVQAAVALLAQGHVQAALSQLAADPLYRNRVPEIREVARLWSGQPGGQQIVNNGPVGSQVNVSGAVLNLGGAAPVQRTRVLFLAANPMDKGRLALDREYRDLSRALDATRHREAVELRHLPDVHLKDIPAELRRFEPRVVHFSGHGGPGGRLVMFDADSQLREMEPKALAGMLGRRSDTIQLVVLNTCSSEGLVDALTQQIACVVGTNDKLSDRGARQFAETFYQALWDGVSVQEAFDDARDVVAGEAPGDEDCLVLRTRAGVDPRTFRVVG